jgi:hypothetical protein
MICGKLGKMCMLSLKLVKYTLDLRFFTFYDFFELLRFLHELLIRITIIFSVYCLRPCLNNGVCVKPNVCLCPKDYAGVACQQYGECFLLIKLTY